MADVTAMWQMEKPLRVDLFQLGVLRCLTEPHPICQADGICLCAY